MGDCIRFGRFELRCVERRLLRDGEPVRLGARAMDLLLVLVTHRDRMVTKGELLDLVWPGLVVEEANVQVQVSALRKALGSSAVATIPGLGYRLSLAIDEDAAQAPLAPPAEAFESPGDRLSPLTSLPPILEPLIGRDDDLSVLSRLMEQHRLVTVTGAGGIGKTRLAHAACLEFAARYPDGVCWVDLAALATGERIVPGIARVARVSLGKGKGLPELVGALSRRRLLLVLDNCEHLVAPLAMVVEAILAGAEQMRILATSQQPLKIKGEHIYRLMPLEVPPPGVGLEQARRFGALALLESRTAAADGRFVLMAANLDRAIELCRQLDGVPLAIEMASARLPMLGFEELQRQLGGRLDLLRAATRDAAPRQQSLRLTLDWSHSLLSSSEQAVLRRLSVFAGSIRLDVAQASADIDMDALAVLEALGGLVDWSLVKLVDHEPPRYRLLETTRIFALEKLDAAGETETMHVRHGRAMATLAEQSLDDPRSAHAPSWLGRFLPDYEDLQVAFERACERHDGDAAAAVLTALRQMDALRGLFSSSGRRVEQAYDLLAHASPLGRARLHSFIASVGWVTVSRGTRVESARQAVALWRSLGDPRRLYGALALAATELARIGEHEAAADALQEARDIEDPRWPAQAIAVRCIHEGWTAHYRGDAGAYRDNVRQAMVLSERAGDRAMVNAARVLLAAASFAAGDFNGSIELAQEAARELRATDQAEYLCYALSLLCEGLLVVGREAEARAAATEALPLATAETEFLPALMQCVAVLAATGGRSADAARLLGYVPTGVAEPGPERDGIDASLIERASAAIDQVLGRDEHLRLRQEGKHMSPREAGQIARDILADGGRETTWPAGWSG